MSPDAEKGRGSREGQWGGAEGKGQVAARNMLGRRARFVDVPFFWSTHYDTSISYVGHAEKWDAVEIDGSPADGDCAVRYMANGQRLAVATVGRDMASLQAERALEGEIARPQL